MVVELDSQLLEYARVYIIMHIGICKVEVCKGIQRNVRGIQGFLFTPQNYSIAVSIATSVLHSLT